MRNNIKRGIKKNSPTILAVFSAAGVIVTTISAVKATPKAIRLLEEAEKKKGDKLTKRETLNIAGPSYIPTVLLLAGTVGCIAGTAALNARIQTSLISAYAALNNSLTSYKQLIEETNPELIEKARLIEMTDNYDGTLPLGDECLFYDELSGRYFTKTVEEVLEAEYEMNREFVTKGYVSLNRLYKLLLIEGVNYGDSIGWSIFDDGYMWIDFVHEEVTIDPDLTCYMIRTLQNPDANYLDC